jgi:hypothetical protein
MRKLFNIDQDEKNRILEMHENATKRHYLNEQPSTEVTEPDPGQSKPTFSSNGVAYYVPGLTDTGWSDFVSVAGSDLMNFITFMSSTGIRTSFENPFKYPKETYVQQYESLNNKMFKEKKDYATAIKELPILANVDYMRDFMNKVNDTYLKYWTPTNKGMAVLSSPNFLNDPNIVNAKKTITNFDEVYPKILNKSSQTSGLKIA